MRLTILIRCWLKGHRWARSKTWTARRRTAWQRCARCHTTRRHP